MFVSQHCERIMHAKAVRERTWWWWREKLNSAPDPYIIDGVLSQTCREVIVADINQVADPLRLGSVVFFLVAAKLPEPKTFVFLPLN